VGAPLGSGAIPGSGGPRATRATGRVRQTAGGGRVQGKAPGVARDGDATTFAGWPRVQRRISLLESASLRRHYTRGEGLKARCQESHTSSADRRRRGGPLEARCGWSDGGGAQSHSNGGYRVTIQYSYALALASQRRLMRTMLNMPSGYLFVKRIVKKAKNTRILPR
jgi:hypothetical protein